MKARIYKTPTKVNKQWSDTPSFDDSPQHYQVPKSTSTSGSDETPAHAIDPNDPPFSPDHYEMGPCFSEDKHPIYENTEFDSQSTKATKDEDVSHIYQNMEFEEKNAKLAAGKRGKQQQSEDEEYINPEEFVRDESTKTTTSTAKTRG